MKTTGVIANKTIVTEYHPDGDDHYHRIWVESAVFDLIEEVHDKVSVGDLVEVTYWPRTGDVNRIEKLRSREQAEADG